MHEMSRQALIFGGERNLRIHDDKVGKAAFINDFRRWNAPVAMNPWGHPPANTGLSEKTDIFPRDTRCIGRLHRDDCCTRTNRSLVGLSGSFRLDILQEHPRQP